MPLPPPSPRLILHPTHNQSPHLIPLTSAVRRITTHFYTALILTQSTTTPIVNDVI